MDGLVEETLGLLPLAACQTDDGTDSPCVAVVRVDVEAALQRGNGLRGVALQHVDLGLHVVASCIVAPTGQHGVKFGQCPGVVAVLNVTKHAIVPQALIFRVIFQGTGIVGHSIGILGLTDAA